MCGIVGYIGNTPAYPILIKGLKRLEYRGYDSAGVAIMQDGIKIIKCKGKVADLETLASAENLYGTVGIGHTRWATHGPPDDKNAHPHLSDSGKMVIIHNGIIENYASLKEGLQKRGYKFKSDTDTEVIVNLTDYIMQAEGLPFDEAVRKAMHEVVGAYAIAVMHCEWPDTIVAAKKGSPLVIGLGEDGSYFLASDATPIIEHTRNVIYLEDEQMAILQKGKPLVVKTIKNQQITPVIHELELELEAIEKGGYEHFMLKEIYEQPRSIRDSLRGRLDPQTGRISMAGLIDYEHKFKAADRIVIVGCGTSWHAGLVGEYLIEEFARIPVEVEYASEFRYRNPIINERDIVIAISQSGETADTLAAIELAKARGATIFGICNVVGSSIARASHAGAYTHAGPEIGVASTKAFTAQVAVLSLIALHLGHQLGRLNQKDFFRLINELNNIPRLVEEVLHTDEYVKYIASLYKDSSNFLYLGRGFNFPVALEGALKLKEISYIHAEGYPAAEMKHGPIALIDENMPVVVIATRRGHYEKIISNIQEVKARGGRIIAIVNPGDETVQRLADHCIEVPETEDAFSPIVNCVPLQLLAYHIAVMRGCNVDQPRNLAKSVTVE
ncbi:MAG: glutamine--fructose-6-phosphate transaminase (isomerizing) [Flavobacteriales bacterium]|nr:glutamine--fructose-6-phosphate transaminase (isomerizing) [Flavobacteriales bacterium]MCX7769146.1 glutamine--fructose-6-phosphate transaminase (isomerizing) [Flavobacteriales bacterium]MDW8410152.1 glutamine--fructose-6-phosphate transaminase (isomerizing) [Flavobacteriales bacterium]